MSSSQPRGRSGTLPCAKSGSAQVRPTSLGVGLFHISLAPEGGEAATVALGRQIPGHRDLSLGPITTPPHRVRRERCDAAETARAARLARRHLWTSSTREG